MTELYGVDLDELEEEVETGPDGLIPPGDCGHEDGTPHGGKVHATEGMCMHEHWSGSQYCDAHLETAVATWWQCGRCHHGACPTIVRVRDTGQTFQFPTRGPVQ